MRLIVGALFALSSITATAGQPTSNDFLPVAQLKKFTNFLSFDRDKEEVGDLQTACRTAASTGTARAMRTS
jgi:hypothetical protein